METFLTAPFTWWGGVPAGWLAVVGGAIGIWWLFDRFDSGKYRG